MMVHSIISPRKATHCTLFTSEKVKRSCHLCECTDSITPLYSSYVTQPKPPSGTCTDMSDVTRILQSIQHGYPKAADELLLLVYGELRELAAQKMAREKPGQTLQATALVHEAWIRLGDGVFANRAHFFGAASEAMRRILVERARRKHRDKRGGGTEHVNVDELEIAAPHGNEEESLAVDEALDRLAAHDARKAEVVKLRYFVGFSFEETAEALGISVPTAKRDWAYARAWLHQEIGTNHPGLASAE
jgi:RNA polymerase sigma factor (TIGR02999 family)